MVEESDGINEALEGAIRVAIAAGARAGEVLARSREEQLHRAAATEDQHAREITERLRAEQATARAELAPVHRAEWWDHADADDVQRVYITAQAWAGAEPEADRALERIRDEIRCRYGIEVHNTGAAPECVREAMNRAEATRAAVEQERTRAAAERTEAQQMITEAAHADRAAETARASAEHQRDPAVREQAVVHTEHAQASAGVARGADEARYDSAERREAFAANLERRGIHQGTIATRMIADVSQANHPSEALRTAGNKAPKVRKSRGIDQREHELSR